MNADRIEILKNGNWVELEFRDSKSVKYNARVNKIGETKNRQIGGSNTFSLPNTWKNINALGINVFNQSQLARSLNSKYNAKYFINDQLIKVGFLLINNTLRGDINVNFVDEAFDVISRWSSITYKELLLNIAYDIPADYAASIAELRGYSLPTNAVLTPLTEVGTRGYNLCLFPNNLNVIGDQFQQNNAGIRVDNVFNPYQSRPVFNAMSLFDLATERFGYTAIYDPSVDWATIESTYMVGSSNKDNEDSDSVFETVPHEVIEQVGEFWAEAVSVVLRATSSLMIFPQSVSVNPADYSNWVNNPILEDNPSLNGNYVFVPNLESGNAGEIDFQFNVSPDAHSNVRVRVILYWHPLVQGDPIVSTYYSSGLPIGDPNEFPAGVIELNVDPAREFDIELNVNKSIINLAPAGVGAFIGMQIGYRQNQLYSYNTLLSSMRAIEVILPVDVIAFDEFGQFLPNTADLTFGAPTESLKTLLTSLMHKEGILMDINNDTKVIKFFTYGQYETQQDNGNYGVWDEYLLKYNPPTWKTNFGNEYGKINSIGLNDPYLGNTFKYNLVNQGQENRYKATAEDYNKNFKDVEQVVNVRNTISPYTEFTNKGLGLIQYRGALAGVLSQQRADGSIQGDFTGLPLMANVNYATIPQGVTEWYRLVDNAVRVKQDFLLPAPIIKNIDLSEPIYIGELGGFYIIEEISEYENSSTPTSVSLIKLIANLNNEDIIPPAAEIRLSGRVEEPYVGFDFWNMVSEATFKYYTPNAATLTRIKYSDNPATGGTPTGFQYNSTLSFPPYIDNQQSWLNADPIGSDAGWYVLKVTDDGGLESNEITLYYGPDTTPATVTISPNQMGTDTEFVNVTYTYTDFNNTPTFATFEFQKWDNTNDVALGPLYSVAFPVSPSTGTVLVDFQNTGFHKVVLKTNEADSAVPPGGGWIVS